MHHRNIYRTLGGGLALALSLTSQANALELYADDDTHLNADVLAVYGWLNSRKNYDGTSGGSTWREGFIKYGLSADQGLGSAGSAYGAFSLVSSGTWGDGDAAGNTDGSERTTKIEDAYLGWRSAGMFPALGQDGLDVSFGRQVVKLGSGFIINDDGPNLGRGPADGKLNRGGAYYIAARHAFDRTAVVRIGGQDGLHGSLQWLKSDNRAQAETELAAGTLDYTAKPGTLGLTWVHGIDVVDQWASDFQKQREGMNIYSLRGEGDAGVENASFAFEYAWQDKDAGNEKAWYAEAGYTFADVAWSPKLTYRYSRYSEGWDSMFNGFSTGYGTWFQGEVASNYAGPFNSNTAIQHLGLKATPLENLSVGVLYFDFDTLHKRDALNLDARELDLYVEWAVNPHLIVTPLVGLYRPDKDESNGGNQVGGNGTNVYSQLIVAVPF
ncbi:alginate export family protein [Pseudomonas sp. R3.Fl]|uniref:alginate export family protein n=1 Tax=Pseudomonas TaxID=286 RepID=UPI00201D7B40|nr:MULTISPECIES: alginate export family protein [Pseudomonas]MCL6692967.1 alginate export family protein [Pseudomonas sp. R3.Fl]UUC52874.1 alginate export family protein [Pseudomonas citronellolis]UXJ50087.1 alginate export family protein [Pseudomonas citronellolis]